MSKLIMGLFAGLVWAGVLKAENHSAVIFPYDDSVGTVSVFSNEEEFPFLLSSKTIANKYVARKYRRFVNRFSSVLDCLVKEPNNKYPDLSSIDWSKIKSTTDADVCLFRIASSYSSVDDFKSWLRHHGFYVNKDFRPRPEAGWYQVVGTRKLTEAGDYLFYGSVIQRILRIHHSMSVTARYDDLHHQVIGMRVTFNSK